MSKTTLPDARPAERRRGEIGTSTLLLLALLVAALGFFAVTQFSSPGLAHEAMVQKVQGDFLAIGTAARMFRNDFNRTPKSLEELLEPPPRALGEEQFQYIEQPPTDPFTHAPYSSDTVEGGFRLICWGSDGEEGGEGHAADLVLTIGPE